MTKPFHHANCNNQTPVILITYNRPGHTRMVLKALERHNRKKLYIFSDGPKNYAESAKVSETRDIIKKIDWCDPEIVERKENIGLARSIVSAVDYVFQKYEKLILLEDDCVPQKYFFEYIEKCLAIYEDNEKIFGINGYTVPVPEILLRKYAYDIYFFPRIGSWGWATWKRAWRYYDPDLQKLYKTAIDNNINMTQGGNDIPKSIINYLNGELKDVWTLNWVLCVYLNNGCYVYPTKSHIENIGNDGTGVHCGSSNRFDTEYAEQPPARFPDDIILDAKLVQNYNRIFGGGQIATKYQTINKVSSKHRKKGVAGRERLNIIHINTQDEGGGAAQVARRLVEAQNDDGQNAFMLVGSKSSRQQYSVSFPTEPDSNVKIQCQREGRLYYEYQGSHKLVNHPLVRSSDVLHFHNLHGGYFNPFTISVLSHLKPVVWTLHDMQSITGHCAHSFTCERWRHGCGNCPNLNVYPEIPVDSTTQLWKEKKRIYNRSFLWIVAPCEWLKNKVEKSILSDHPVELIYNAVDTTVFQPYDRREMRKELGIPEKCFVLGSVAHGSTLRNPWKGGEYTLAALKELIVKYPQIVFLNIGARNPSSDPRIINIPHISDETLLSKIYSSLDIFLYTSKADTCPLVVLEALSCGVPIVTFNTGGVPELVRNKLDGFVTAYKDVKAIVQAVEFLISDAKLRKQCSRNARLQAIRKFDQKTAYKAYGNLYNKCMTEHSNRVPTAKLFRPAELPKVILTPPFFDSEKHKAKKLDPVCNSALISVITPSFNQGRFIEQTIQSVVNQDDANFEHIIIDGGSTDETINNLKRYPHLKWISESDSGQADALNKGLNMAGGEIIAWINSDDWYEPGIFRAVATFFADNPDKNIVMGDCHLVDKDGSVFDRVINTERGFDELKDYWIGRSIPTQPAIFFRKKLLDEFGYIDDSLHYTMDYDLWMRFAQKNTFYHIDTVAANYRFHEDAKIGDRQWSKIYPECEQVRRRYVKDEKVKVSVIIPCYNYGHYLMKAVESVVNQSFQNFEIIIVNDGSTDDSKIVAEQAIHEYPDHSIKLINQSNSGQPAIARNNGIKKSNGEYVLPLDADDYLSPRALEAFVDVAIFAGKYAVVFGWVQKFGQENNLWRTDNFDLELLLRRNQLPNCSMFHRSLWEQQGGYKTNVAGYEDWDFWIGAAESGAHFINVPEISFYYRRTEDNSLVDEARRRHEWLVAAMISNHQSIYEDVEVAWAFDYLQCFPEPPGDRKLHGPSDKFPQATALMVTMYPEYYTPVEVKWARQYLSKDPFRIEKGIQSLHKKLPDLNIVNIKKTEALSRPSQERVCQLFKGASQEFYKGHFSDAEKAMADYRLGVNYDSFLKNDYRACKNPKVSVVIVAYNTNELLLDCLNSVTNQSVENFEIIVVDNGGNGRVREKLANYPILHVRCPINFVLSEGRNIGVYFAKGDIVAFLDDDAVVPDNYIEQVMRAFEHYDIYGLRGKVLPKTHSKNNEVAQHYDLGDRPTPAIINTEGNSAFLRKIYVAMDGMNPLLFGCEGTELSYRIKEAYGDCKTIYFPGVVIFHDFAPHSDKLNEKVKRHFFMEKYIYSKHPGIQRWMSEAFKNVSNKDIMERGKKVIQEKSPPCTSYDVIMVWYQNDWGLYGRRNEMIAKALVKHGKIRQILHLEPPINVERLRAKEKPNSMDDNFDVNLRRIKLSSDEGVRIFTPHTPDGLSNHENRNIVLQQIRDVIAEKQFENLILWLYPPHELSELILDEFSSKAQLIVSDCVDDHRKYAADENRYKDTQRRYKKILRASDIVFCVSEALQKDFIRLNPRTYFIPNAAADLNTKAIPEAGPEGHRPIDMIGIKGPVIGYVGALSFRIDCKLLETMARQKPEWNIVLIGPLPNRHIKELSRRDNVHVLGPKQYRQIHAYISHFDVCIIPHIVNDVTSRMNPLKLYEYLQHGKPVVATSVAGVEEFKQVIEVSNDPEEFIKAIENCLENNSHDKTVERINAVKTHTWPRRVDDMVKLLLQNNTRKSGPPIPSHDDSPDPSYFRHTRPDIQKLIPQSASRILDVGCGSGILGAALKKRQQCYVTGIEYVEDVAEEARKHLDAIYTGDVVEKIDMLPSGAYDCIILADILEHLADPKMVLEKLKRCLTRNGRIVASIPNVRHWSVIRDLLEGRWDYTDAGILDRTHLRFFTKSSMLEMFQDAGLEVESVDATTIVNCTVPNTFIEGLEKSDIDIHNLAEEGQVYQYLFVAKAGSALPQLCESEKLVSIIILAHNQLDYTQKCLSSIIEHTARPIELIVVDNGSTDGTAEFLEQQVQQQYPGVSLKIITNRENAGFAGGNNQGIAEARGDFIVLLNNDVVVSPNWLNRMLVCFEKDSRIGIVGPMSNYVSGPQLVNAVDYNTSTLAGLNAFSEKFTMQHKDQIQPYWRVVGFCMLIKRQVIERIGGLDGRYGLGNFEDDDFSLRAAIAGFDSVIAKDCFVHHFGHRTFTGANIDMGASLTSNWNIFKEKWGLPADLAYGAHYDLSEIVKSGFDSSKHYIPVVMKTDNTIELKRASRIVLPQNSDNETITLQGGNNVKPFEQMYQEIKPLIENGWYDAAISALEKIVENYPDKAIAYQELGALYYQQGQTENALASYRKAMQLEPQNIVAQKNLADFYYAELGQADEALKIYENILVVAPHDVQTLILAGHINVSMNRFEAAKVKYQQVLAVEPWNADARQYLEALDKHGAGEGTTKSAATLYQEIEPLVNNGQIDAAIYELEELLATYPEFALAHNDLGVLYFRQGDKTAAQLHYEHAARYEPDNMIFQKNLADFYFVELNRIQEAMDIYVKILEANPEDVETLLTAGHISVALQRLDDARNIYSRVLEIEPWNADARQFLEALDNPQSEARCDKSPQEMYQEIQPLLNNGNPETAMQALQNLLTTHPDFALAHNDLGVLCYQQGHKETAQSHYERAAQLQPDNLTFQKNLADFYFVELNRVEEAMDMYLQILENHPEDVETLMTAGHISAALQRFGDARTIYERVLEVEPWNADARQCLENIENEEKGSNPEKPVANVNISPIQGNSAPFVS